MSNILALVFIIQFLVLIGVLLAKVYNIFNLGQFYTIKVAILLFITHILSFGLGVACFMLNVIASDQEYLYMVLFRLESWTLPLSIVFLIIEIFFYYNLWINTDVKAFQTNKQK